MPCRTKTRLTICENGVGSKRTKKVGYAVLKLSKKVEYGLMALLHLDELEPGELVSTKDLSEQFNIPADLLGKVLQALARAGVLESVHGAHGGYRLQRPLDELTLGDVMAAVEGPLHLVRCHESPDTCDQYGTCNIRGPVLRIQEELTSYLSAFRLGTFRRRSEMAKQATG